MANYIKRVIRKGKYIKAMARWEDVELHFLINGGRITPIAREGLDRQYVPKEIFAKIRSQLEGIIADRKRPAQPTDKEFIITDNLGGARPINRQGLTKEFNDRLDILSKYGIQILENGQLQINRWEKEAKQIILVPQMVKDLDAAIRMQDHILDNYRRDSNRPGELTALETLENEIRDINGWLCDWKSGAEREADLRERIQILFAKLENCRNEHKVEVAEQLMASWDLTDILGRLNPGAIAARTVAMLNHLAARLNQTRLIVPTIALRRELLKIEKRQILNQLAQSELKLKNILHRSEADLEANPLDIDRQIGQTIFFLQSVLVNSYLPAVINVRADLLAAKKLLRANMQSDFKTILMAAITKIIPDLQQLTSS